VRRRAILTLGCLLVVLGALTVVVSDDPGAQAPPTSTAAASVEHEPVPILMFHIIGTRHAGVAHPTLWVSPRALRSYLRALRGAGYDGVTLGQVWNAWHHGATLPRRPIVLSFDDGYAGQVAYALPALKRLGWSGVLNLKLDNLARMGGTAAVRRLLRAGWEVDSHTVSHSDLTTLSAAAVKREIAGSRTRLRKLFGVPVDFFAYPGGRHDDDVIAAVKDAGYEAATTAQLGWARRDEDPFAMPRVRVDGGMSARAVLQRLRDARAPRR